MKIRVIFILTVMLCCLTIMSGCDADDESNYKVDKEKAEAFAGPILEKLKSETPVYAEDFSDNSKGWYINTEESYGYTANVSTEGKYDLDIDTKQLGADFPDSPILSDFVLQFDFVYKSGGNDSSCYFIYRNQEVLEPGNSNSYGLEIYYNSLLRLYKYIQEYGGDATIRDINMDKFDLLEVNTYTIIVKGTTHIVYVND
ncbi:MAG TPA: hypothetical protein P5123_05715, partial [Spirochaetota bacterium]|nr:hypothetical protein [Spirochaetota bacterium]